MSDLNAAFLALSIDLTKLAIKGTATAITNKIKSIKDEKNVENIKNTYDEIINELLNEREEAVRIAQAYKSALEQVVISDQDINHLHNTVSRILELVKKSQLSKAQTFGSEAVKKTEEQVETYEQIKELISVDTLKAMQLLGFNYKAAIGEPLTIMLKNFILSKTSDPDSFKPLEKLLIPEMVDILKNKLAYDNFKELTGLSPKPNKKV